MSLVTTEPEPITVLLPMVTPGFTTACAPIHTLSPMTMGLQLSSPLARTSASRGCVAAHRLTRGPTITSSPMEIRQSSRTISPKFAKKRSPTWRLQP